MKKGEVIGSLLILFLTVWGCWALMQTWKKESVWTPRISFYVPGFMFKANPQTRAPDPLSTTALPAPEPATQPVDLSATYVFSNTPLPIIEADQSLEKETNAALKYKKLKRSNNRCCFIRVAGASNFGVFGRRAAFKNAN